MGAALLLLSGIHPRDRFTWLLAFFCLLGALTAQLALSRVQDRLLASLPGAA